MTVDQAIARTYLLATGKASPALVSGSTKYTKILALLNMYKDVWANQPNVQWASLRAMYSVPTLVSTATTYPLGSTNLSHVSAVEGDYVRIYWPNGINESDYTLVSPENLYGGGPIRNGFGDTRRSADGNCAISGTNIIFDKAFPATNGQIGGTILIPYYPVPANMTTGTDVIAVDDPNWLCFISAAEYVRNDITKQNQYGNLVAQATDAFNGMFERNDAQVSESNMDTWSPPGETW